MLWTHRSLLRYELPESLLANLFTCYDPSTGFARGENPPLSKGVSPIDPSRFKRLPGFDVWPPDLGLGQAQLKIMTVGGSTSDRCCGGSWPMHLQQLLAEKAGITALVFNGGCASYHAGQELQKIQRDGPALMPDLILSLSGINDMPWMHVQDRHPYLHQYQAKVAEGLGAQSSEYESFTLGLPCNTPSSDNWLRHTSYGQAAAGVLGAHYLAFLQPAMGAGAFEPSEEEQRIWSEQVTEQYLESIEEHYGAIRARLPEFPFITDISQVFAEESDVYMEYRHPGEKGNQLIAQRIFQELVTRQILISEHSIAG